MIAHLSLVPYGAPSCLWGNWNTGWEKVTNNYIFFFFSECCQLICSIKKDVFTAVCFRGSGESLNFITWVSSTTKGVTHMVWWTWNVGTHTLSPVIVTLHLWSHWDPGMSPWWTWDQGSGDHGGDLLSVWFNYTRSITLWLSGDRTEGVCVCFSSCQGRRKEFNLRFCWPLVSLLSVVP